MNPVLTRFVPRLPVARGGLYGQRRRADHLVAGGHDLQHPDLPNARHKGRPGAARPVSFPATAVLVVVLCQPPGLLARPPLLALADKTDKNNPMTTINFISLLPKGGACRGRPGHHHPGRVLHGAHLRDDAPPGCHWLLHLFPLHHVRRRGRLAAPRARVALLPARRRRHALCHPPGEAASAYAAAGTRCCTRSLALTAAVSTRLYLGHGMDVLHHCRLHLPRTSEQDLCLGDARPAPSPARVCNGMATVARAWAAQS